MRLAVHRATRVAEGHPLVVAALDTAQVVIRVNQVGYLPELPKIAVVCSLRETGLETFTVLDTRGTAVLGPVPARPGGPFAACIETYRLDFSELRREGDYVIAAGSARSPTVTIARAAYEGMADSLLSYMRQQRSGYNPVFDATVHTLDGIIVDHPTRTGETIPATGGWADAADYLQYVTTSANATFVMLMADRDHSGGFGDGHDARGRHGANGISDALDEARHGLEWLLRMYPGGSDIFNQIADDRDHAYWDLPVTDSSDYGFGRGGPRPVYPCTSRPQGLFASRNRSDGVASTAGKIAAALAAGARAFAATDTAFAALLAERAAAVYQLGVEDPGVCQTAPGRSPYFYEEDNWVDDMELAATQLHVISGDPRYLTAAREYAEREPVTPWMGADTARHYQWYPWHNNGHHELWREGGAEERRLAVEYYRRGIEAVVARADNGFRVGIPFVWCSSNLMASFATQAHLYRTMSGDDGFIEYEMAALDWLFGTNPWGVSMLIGLPADGRFPRDPHSVVSNELGIQLTGGLVDGPVYRSIFGNLRGISLHDPDEFAPFNTGFIVYHDDIGDYSTNEPIMDGTANLTYLLAALADRAK
ncbi:MAG: glycoside hydrolase family 9 protein [Gemmatimonadaceae bacterium]